MPSPFEDGGTTKTIDIPPVEAEPPPRSRAALPWAAVIAAVLVALTVLVVIVVVLVS